MRKNCNEQNQDKLSVIIDSLTTNMSYLYVIVTEPNKKRLGKSNKQNEHSGYVGELGYHYADV